MLGILAILLPLVLIVLIWRSTRGSLIDLHHAVLAFALAISITLVLTEILKISVGRLRPDFLARCQPVSTSVPNSECGSADESLIQEGQSLT
jgi:diacylglycerol diphosphate phosphatase/phosphatidate phosphatase